MGKIDKDLIKGSFILLIVFNLYSFLNFIFQASMARLLSISDYGILGALFYLVYILGIFGESIQNIFAKTSATEKDNGYLKNITKRFYKKIGPLTGIFFIFYLLLGLLLYYLKE